jgi:hypothetical protein
MLYRLRGFIVTLALLIEDTVWPMFTQLWFKWALSMTSAPRDYVVDGIK